MTTNYDCLLGSISSDDEELLLLRLDSPSDEITWPQGMTYLQRRSVLWKTRLAFAKWKEANPSKVIGSEYIVVDEPEEFEIGTITHCLSLNNLTMMFAPVIFKVHLSLSNLITSFVDLTNLGLSQHRPYEPNVDVMRKVDISDFVYHSHSETFGFDLSKHITDPESLFTELINLQIPEGESTEDPLQEMTQRMQEIILQISEVARQAIPPDLVPPQEIGDVSP